MPKRMHSKKLDSKTERNEQWINEVYFFKCYILLNTVVCMSLSIISNVNIQSTQYQFYAVLSNPINDILYVIQ